jgi:hypothetical protein
VRLYSAKGLLHIHNNTQWSLEYHGGKIKKKKWVVVVGLYIFESTSLHKPKMLLPTEGTFLNLHANLLQFK